MNKRQATTLSVLTIIALVLGIMLSRRLWFRLDLTKAKSYTISPVSRNLHNEIPDQVRITYYLSDKLKAIHPLPGEVEDLLKEYASYSRGKIRLTVKDPIKANMAELIEQVGIIPQQIPIREQDQTSFVIVYSGIVIEYLDEIDVLPWMFSPETLEYDLTSRIRSLVQGRSRTLAVLLGDDPRRWNEDYRQLQISLMQAGYQLRPIAPGMDIPETIPALLVLGGVETFDEVSLYQIDRYIQTGGRVLFSVKGVMIEMEGELEGRLLEDSGLLAMLSSYGVTVMPEIAMDQTALTMQYQTRSPNGMIQIRMARYNQWIRVLGENSNPDHPVCAYFNGLDLYWASPLVLHEPQGVEAVPLFTSTAEAWSMREPFYLSPDMPAYLLQKDLSATRGTKVLGASLSGLFPSWFAGRPKPSPPDDLDPWIIDQWPQLADMPAETRPARIIVIGDIDFATSIMNATGGQRNLDFLLSAADWLGNDDDIVGIRNRVSGSDRLDRIADGEKRAAAMWFAQIINVFLIPLLVVAAGVFIALRRRAKARPSEKEHHDDV